jgi:hypothetical protein
MERKSLGRGIEDISNVYMSDRKDNKTPGGFSSKKYRVKEPLPDNAKIECRIEESVAVRRTIAYPSLPNAQQNILKALSRHLDENFSITSIDLRKTDEILRPGKMKSINEAVTICIED